MPHDEREQAVAATPDGFEFVGWCWPGPYRWLMSMMDDGGDPAPREGLRPMYAPVDLQPNERALLQVEEGRAMQPSAATDPVVDGERTAQRGES